MIDEDDKKEEVDVVVEVVMGILESDVMFGMGSVLVDVEL